MMYMHYCKRCQRVHMLNGHKLTCPRCDFPLTELQISYMDYILMSQDQRKVFDNKLKDKSQLDKLSTTYRLYKYSKWYKQLNAQKQVPESTHSLELEPESHLHGMAFTLS